MESPGPPTTTMTLQQRLDTLTPSACETLLPTWSHEQLERVRRTLRAIDDDYGLLAGQEMSVVGAGEFRGYGDFQLQIEYGLIWGGQDLTWCGGRGSTKSWTCIDAYLKRCLIRPGTRITWVAGGSTDQVGQPAEYWENYWIAEPRLDKYKGNKWTETFKSFKNGSAIKFSPATPKGAQSRRANVLHVDEAQMLDPTIYKFLTYQATKKGSQFNMTGTAISDTLFHQSFVSSGDGRLKIMTPIHVAVSAGIVDIESVIKQMDDPLVPTEEKNEQLWCIWQRASDRVLAPVFIRRSELPADVVPYGWGIDFNGKKVEHWCVEAGRSGSTLYAMRERQIGLYSDVLTLPGDLFPEDDGFNTGFVQALERENEIFVHRKSISPVNWRGDAKSRTLGEVVRKQEHGELVVVVDDCPQLARDITRIPFNSKGVPDKEKAEKLGLNPHVVDAAILAWLNGFTERRTRVAGSS